MRRRKFIGALLTTAAAAALGIPKLRDDSTVIVEAKGLELPGSDEVIWTGPGLPNFQYMALYSQEGEGELIAAGDADFWREKGVIIQMKPSGWIEIGWKAEAEVTLD